MRRFEHAGHGKFWSIECGGTVIAVRWGKLGTQGQQLDRMLPSDEAAANKAQELIDAQLAAGYVEVRIVEAGLAPAATRWYRRYETKTDFIELVLDNQIVRQRRGRITTDGDEYDNDREDSQLFQGSTLPTAEDARASAAKIAGLAFDQGYELVFERGELPELPFVDDEDPDAGPKLRDTRVTAPSHPELEAHCFANRDDPAPWAIYADWLMTQDDPRGELAALRTQDKHPEANAKFARVKRALLGSFEVAKAVTIKGYRHGFPCFASIRREPDRTVLPELTRAFLAKPFAMFVDALQFGLASFASDNDWRPTLEAVIDSAQAIEMRALRFDDYTRDECEISWTPFGDFSQAWSHLPRLEELRIQSGEGGVLGHLDLPELRTFVRVSGGLRASELESICNARWPKLEHLEIWFGSAAFNAEGNVTRIRDILDGKGLGNLRHLGLCNCEFSASLIAALSSSAILPRLRTLDLGKGVMGAGETRELVARAQAFAHLESIDLDSNQLLDSELDVIAAALPQIRRGVQRAENRDEDDEDELDDYRFVALGE